jgi:hypothetical protein
MPEILVVAVKRNAIRSEISTSDLVQWLIAHALDDSCDISELSDAQGAYDAKLDIRLPEEKFARLRSLCKQSGRPVSVYIRILLYAYYSQKLVFREASGRYTLVYAT